MVECLPSKQNVASSSLVSRSNSHQHREAQPHEVGLFCRAETLTCKLRGNLQPRTHPGNRTTRYTYKVSMRVRPLTLMRQLLQRLTHLRKNLET